MNEKFSYDSTGLVFGGLWGGKGWSTDDPDKQRDYIKHNLYHKLS